MRKLVISSLAAAQVAALSLQALAAPCLVVYDDLKSFVASPKCDEGYVVPRPLHEQLTSFYMTREIRDAKLVEPLELRIRNLEAAVEKAEGETRIAVDDVSLCRELRDQCEEDLSEVAACDDGPGFWTGAATGAAVISVVALVVALVAN